tara:strand:- start:3454 stop:3690 length:237 start_codon:yes stop_codon:yes gene_type:complete
MKTPTPNFSERLIVRAVKEIKRRKITIYRMAKEVPCYYNMIYLIFNPDKKTYKRVGKPKFSYETGKQIENWLESSSSK